MTINKAKDLLESLQNNTFDKGEIKVYQKFIGILNSIENRNLSTSEKDLIEKKLTTLDLANDTRNRKKYIRKKSNEFLQYLESEFSIVLKDHYTNYGVSIGMVFGMTIGTSIFKGSDGIAIGMCLGMCLGYIIGQQMDKNAAKQNQVLNIA